jgi:putative peptidoglycan binding protein
MATPRFTHTEARAFVTLAFTFVFGRAPTAFEAMFLQAIGWLETNYGSSWQGVGVGSFNMGAIQQGGWSGAVFTYTDTHPNADGTSTPYKIGFRKYSSAVDGFVDLCKVVYVVFSTRKEALAAAGRGDILAFSTALHKYPCYYEGFGATDAARIANHAKAVTNAIRLQCAEIGDPLPPLVVPTGPLPTVVPALLLGAKGPSVSAWQAIVGVAQDGDFGALTQSATRAWQTKHGLPPNGVVQEADLVAAGLA